jgi:hypothetical protein
MRTTFVAAKPAELREINELLSEKFCAIHGITGRSVTGDMNRKSVLALEHSRQFPDDGDVIKELAKLSFTKAPRG